jgi:hypothetical protein
MSQIAHVRIGSYTRGLSQNGESLLDNSSKSDKLAFT